MKKKKWIKWSLWIAVVLPVVVIALYYFDLGAIQTRRQIRQYEASQPYRRLKMLRNAEEEIFFQYDNGGRIYYSGGQDVSDDGWLWKYGALQSDGSRVVTMELQYSAPANPPCDQIQRVMVTDVQGAERCNEQTEYKHGEEISHTTFVYNDCGQVTRIRTEYTDPAKAPVTLTYQWDEKGRMIGSTEENADGRTETTCGRNIYGDVDRVRWSHTALDGAETHGRQVYLWRYTWHEKVQFWYPEKWCKESICIYGTGAQMRVEFCADDKESPLQCVWWRFMPTAQAPQLLNRHPWLFAHGEQHFSEVYWTQE